MEEIIFEQITASDPSIFGGKGETNDMVKAIAGFYFFSDGGGGGGGGGYDTLEESDLENEKNDEIAFEEVEKIKDTDEIPFIDFLLSIKLNIQK